MPETTYRRSYYVLCYRVWRDTVTGRYQPVDWALSVGNVAVFRAVVRPLPQPVPPEPPAPAPVPVVKKIQLGPLEVRFTAEDFAMSQIVFDVLLPALGAPDVVKRRLSLQIGDAEPVLVPVGLQDEAVRGLKAPQGANVTVSLVDVDEAGNESEASVTAFEAKDVIPPVRPEAVDIVIVGEEPDEVPAEEAPVEEAPVVEEPAAEEAPAEEVPAEEPVVEGEPIAEAPVAEEAPAEMPAEEVPGEEVPAEQPAEEPAVVEEAPAEDAVVEEPVAETDVVEEAPVEESLSEAPVEDVPVEESLSEAPVEDVPAEDAPAAEGEQL